MTAVRRKLLGLMLFALSSGSVLAEPAENIQIQNSAEQQTEPDKCNQTPEQDKLPEKVQSGIHEFSCRTVRWIDSLFGNSADFDEDAVGGIFSMGMTWNEFEGLEGKARYRVRTDLPNFNSRWDGFFGRVDEQAHISDTETLQDRSIRQGVSGRDENQWLLGLGYDDREGSDDGWDYSVGLRLQTPIRVYTKARYRKAARFNPSTDLHYQQTFFWRDGIGFGTTSYFDLKRDLHTTDVLRWELLATLSESTDGTDWWVGNTWYHSLGNQRGISLLTFVSGETDTEVPLHEYGFELTLRRQLSRDWLFINVGPTLTWPRLESDQRREASLGFALLLDFEFGRKRD